jgi:hypothetical protein
VHRLEPFLFFFSIHPHIDSLSPLYIYSFRSMFSLRGIRHSGRSYSTLILIFTTISTTLLTLHLYRKDKQRQESIELIPSLVIEQSRTLSNSITEKIEKKIRTCMNI